MDRLLPFYPPKDPENQNFEKMRKTPEHIIILRICTINNDHMMCGSWDMECNGQNLSFWTIFCPFTPLTTQKNKIFKKWEKHLELSSFYPGVPKIMIICYNIPEIQCVADVIFIFNYLLNFLLGILNLWIK